MPRLAFFYLVAMLCIEIIAYIAQAGKPHPAMKSFTPAFVVVMVINGLKAAATWYLWSLNTTWDYRTVVAGILSFGYVVYTVQDLIEMRRQVGHDRPGRKKLSAVIQVALNVVELGLVLALAFAR